MQESVKIVVWKSLAIRSLGSEEAFMVPLHREKLNYLWELPTPAVMKSILSHRETFDRIVDAWYIPAESAFWTRKVIVSGPELVAWACSKHDSGEIITYGMQALASYKMRHLIITKLSNVKGQYEIL